MIRETILETMSNKNIKAAQLCREVGIDKSNFSKFMKGKYFLSEETLEKVLFFLKLELKEKTSNQ